MAAPPPLRVNPKAPELGSFPLDHFRECKAQIESYFRCMEEGEYLAPLCRERVKEYLHCRMEKGLMNPADVASFGLPTTEFVPTRQHTFDRMADAKRGGGAAAAAGAVWEQRYKRKDLMEDDGFERPMRRAAAGGRSPPPPPMATAADGSR